MSKKPLYVRFQKQTPLDLDKEPVAVTVVKSIGGALGVAVAWALYCLATLPAGHCLW